MTRSFTKAVGLLALALTSGWAGAVELRVEVGSRAPGDWDRLTDQAVRRFAKQTARLTDQSRAAWRRAGLMSGPLALPTTVVLTRNGRPLAPNRLAPGDIVPTFDASGARAFPTTYRQRLESVFASARPVMNAVFGDPASGGTVRIKNYDADIQDRYAVAGGYYVPNAPGGPEVRFPVYNNTTATAINYIHTLLLAYRGSRPMPFDAYSEGMVRAATMQVARTPGALPGNPTEAEIEAVLEGLYDLSPFYDWYNQPVLGGPKFVAPNLLNTELPPGGSTGGVFLLRYQMAGTAWAKALAERPGLIAEFNSDYDANPNAYQTQAALEALGQSALDTVAGQTGATIEGVRFDRWAMRQAILDTRFVAGLKVHVQPFPGIPEPGTEDFGVFGIVLNAWRTAPNGDETLLAGSCNPIFWRPDFNRFFTAAQEDVIDVAGGYGSAVPNFPGETFSNQPYRVTADLPFGGAVGRVHLPAGAVSTAARPDPNTFFGTLSGLPDPGAGSYVLVVRWVGGQQTGITARNFAFGASIVDPAYLRPGPVTVQVFRREGTSSVLQFERKVNKGKGSLGLDLRTPNSEVTAGLTLPARLGLFGPTVQPYRPETSDLLGLTPGQTLVARWNAASGQFDLYPREGGLAGGLGYWVRPPAAVSRSVTGVRVPRLPVSVALNPGWNLVSIPFNETLETVDVRVTVGAEAVRTYAEARSEGTLGPQFFRWTPDATDADGGTMTAASDFRPGQAYYVRADRPEGAVLVFAPSGSNRPEGTRRVAAKHVEQTLERQSMARVLWEAKAEVMRARSPAMAVSFGQARAAGRGWDRGLDTDSPPQASGSRVVSLIGRSALARDIRSAGDTAPFTLSVEGLTPGRPFALRFSFSKGGGVLLVRDGVREFRVEPGREYLYTPSASSQRFQVYWRAQ